MSQVSAFALVGQTLADTTTNDNRGIIGMLLDAINRVTKTFNNVAETKIAIEDGSGSGDYEDEDEIEEDSNGNKV